jgi:hypothetical protein
MAGNETEIKEATMSKLGKRLTAAAREGRSIARGEADPATYRIHVPAAMVSEVAAVSAALAGMCGNDLYSREEIACAAISALDLARSPRVVTVPVRRGTGRGYVRHEELR